MALPLARPVLPIAKPVMPTARPVLPIAKPVSKFNRQEQKQDEDDNREPPWVMVHSTNVASIRYWPKQQWLDVWFYDIRTKRLTTQYRYYDVPAEEWQDFRNAPSFGQFVYYVLREGSPAGSKYQYEIIKDLR